MIPDLPGWDSLPAVTRYHNWAEMAGIIAVAVLVVAEVIQYKYGHRRDDLITLEQTATNQRHDEELARVHLETAQAKEKTEELRRQNLELEEAVAPRSLEQGHSSAALKEFAGTQVFLTSVPEFESRRFLRYMALMFTMAEWKVDFLPPNENIMDGIEVEYVSGFVKNSNPTVFDFNERGKQAAETLLAELAKQKLVARSRWIPHSYAGQIRPEIPLEALVVRVGAKPMTYFMEQKYPQLKEQREHMEKVQEAIKKQIEERRRRLESLTPPQGSPTAKE